MEGLEVKLGFMKVFKALNSSIANLSTVESYVWRFRLGMQEEGFVCRKSLVVFISDVLLSGRKSYFADFLKFGAFNKEKFALLLTLHVARILNNDSVL